MSDILPHYFEKKNNGFGTTKRFVPNQPMGIGQERPGPGNYNITDNGIAANFENNRMSQQSLLTKGYSTDLKQ